MRIGLAKHISWQKYNNVVYILDERTELVRKLEGVGAALWDIIIGGHEYDDILTNLLSMISAQRADVDSALRSFLGELLAYGIVEEEDEKG